MVILEPVVYAGGNVGFAAPVFIAVVVEIAYGGWKCRNYAIDFLIGSVLLPDLLEEG